MRSNERSRKRSGTNRAIRKSSGCSWPDTIRTRARFPRAYTGTDDESYRSGNEVVLPHYVTALDDSIDGARAELHIAREPLVENAAPGRTSHGNVRRSVGVSRSLIPNASVEERVSPTITMPVRCPPSSQHTDRRLPRDRVSSDPLDRETDGGAAEGGTTLVCTPKHVRENDTDGSPGDRPGGGVPTWRGRGGRTT